VAGDEPAFIGDEPKQLSLGRLPPTPHAAADGMAQAAEVPSSVGAGVAGSPGPAPSL
jgi:hypothetical protein